MRSKMLASLLSMFCLVAFSGPSSGFDASGSTSVEPEVAVANIPLASFANPPTISVAANFQVAEAESISPSDRMPSRATPAPEMQSTPAPHHQSLLMPSGIAPYQLPYAPGPSGPSYLLKYLNCDPHSCPNIWQGYDAQRAAELAAKCTPPGGGCGCGRGCGLGCCQGGMQLYPSPCLSCGTGSICSKPINRYRSKTPVTSMGCDTCDASVPSAAPCASCQAAKESASHFETAKAPVSTLR